mmetsp:Transcript_20849/g.54268  ORF Transcript_20849/g.54268 Transcript_20849/m.54268 type:complete len:298 (-) Transcript_20849:111-1004(-)
MTLVFGVLNLIVAVIVDTFAENRSKDVGSRAQEMEAQELEEKSILKKIFHKIDEDGSGALSFDELESGAKKVSEFSQWLRVMDIDDGDLRQLFEIVDGDGSGEVDPQEFADAMFRMKNTEAKTATKFVKHLVTRLDYEARDMHADLTLTLAGLTERTEKALQMLEPQNQVVDKALKDSSTTKQIRAESLELRFQEQVAKDVMAEVVAQNKQLPGRVLGSRNIATSKSLSKSDAGSLPDVTKVGEATWDTAHLPDAFAHRRPDDSAARPASCSRPFFLQASGGGLGVTHYSEGGADVA